MFKPIWPNCPIAEPSTVNQISSQTTSKLQTGPALHSDRLLSGPNIPFQTISLEPIFIKQAACWHSYAPFRALKEKTHTHTPLHHHMEQRPQREATAAPNFTPRAFLKPQTACLQGNCAGLCVWQLFTSLHIHKYTDKYVCIHIYIRSDMYILYNS